METSKKKSFDRREVARRLEEIATRSGGSLTPEAVVEDAKHQESPLHDYFEWDVDLAAEKHWLETARGLIRSVEVVVRHERVEVKAPVYVRDPSKASKDAGYVEVQQIQTRTAVVDAIFDAEKARVLDAYRRLIPMVVSLDRVESLDEALQEIADEVRRMVDAIKTREPSRATVEQDYPGTHP